MLTLVTLSFAVRECTGSGKACQKKSRRQLQHNGSTEGINHDDHNAGVDAGADDDEVDYDGMPVEASRPWYEGKSNHV